jgi:photosystem II stability/assembly factor-like uncharacterized protein
MNFQKLLVLIGSMILLTSLACGPLTAAAPTATSEVPSPALPVSSPAVPPTQEASLALQTPTATPAEEATLPPGASPTPAPAQPAASAHYKAGAPIKLDEIHMFSLTEGWGLSGPYVLVTRDGGLTWREQTPPENFAEGTPDKVYGVFLDTRTAWAIFSTGNQIPPEASVWHTTDGGQTWTPGASLGHQVIGEQVWAQFAVFDTGNIWLLVRGVYHGAGTHYINQLFRTQDGGLTWTNPYDGDVNWDYTGMVFADANNGWLTWETNGAYAPGPPDYAVTTDGGASWDSRELPPPSDKPDLFNQYDYCESYQPNLLSASSVRLLVGCFDAHEPPQQFVSYLYASDDGGATWSIYPLPADVLASNDTLIFFGAGTALLLGRDMYATKDGGRTWLQIKTVNWDGQFSFVDPSNGWAVATANGQIALVKTVNGGVKWTEIKPVIGK